MIKKQKKHYEDDDGRVICSMDVEGTRWQNKGVRHNVQPGSIMPSAEQMTPSESWRYTWSAVLAGLFIVLVFSGTWVLFILFCTKIWFR